MRLRHGEHGPRRLWYAPWTVICRCGLRAWPCYVALMRKRQRAAQPVPQPAPEPGSDWPARNGSALRVPRAAAPTDRPLLTRGQAHRSQGRAR